MSDTVETATNAVSGFAKSVAKDATVGAVQTAAGLIIAWSVLVATGTVMEKIQTRRTKKIAVQEVK